MAHVSERLSRRTNAVLKGIRTLPAVGEQVDASCDEIAGAVASETVWQKGQAPRRWASALTWRPIGSEPDPFYDALFDVRLCVF